MREAGPRILVVDDDDDGLLLLGESLRLRAPGCAVELLASAAQAAERLRHPPAPSLVLLDVNIAGESGLDLLAFLRDQPSVQRVPVVVWSGEHDPGAAAEADQLGVAWYTQKPGGLDELDAFIDRLLELSGRSDPGS